jgi:glycosyltransferase involved in cell wall biosynthesis
MAAGVPVVSTVVGAEGLRYTNGEDIVLADDAASFAAACIRLLSNDEVRRGIAHNAMKRAQNEFSWEAVGREFEAILDRNRIISNQVTTKDEQ